MALAAQNVIQINHRVARKYKTEIGGAVVSEWLIALSEWSTNKSETFERD